MNFNDFKQIIKTLVEVRERSFNIHQLGIDLMDYEEPYHTVITLLLNSVFEEQGNDWISWYIYEKPGFRGEINHATDKDGNEICHNVESLWDTVKTYRKQ